MTKPFQAMVDDEQEGRKRGMSEDLKFRHQLHTLIPDSHLLKDNGCIIFLLI